MSVKCRAQDLAKAAGDEGDDGECWVPGAGRCSLGGGPASILLRPTFPIFPHLGKVSLFGGERKGLPLPPGVQLDALSGLEGHAGSKPEERVNMPRPAPRPRPAGATAGAGGSSVEQAEWRGRTRDERGRPCPNWLLRHHRPEQGAGGSGSETVGGSWFKLYPLMEH